MRNDISTGALIWLVVPLGLALVLALLSIIVWPQRRTPGWRLLSPGFGYWLAFGSSITLAGLVGSVWTFVGSTRPDGAFQMQVAWWLAFLFGCGAAVMGWRIASIHRLRLGWRGETLRWSGVHAVQMRDLEAMEESFVGFTRLRFRGGASVAVDASAYGASDLIEKIEDVNGLATEDRPGEH